MSGLTDPSIHYHKRQLHPCAQHYRRRAQADETGMATAGAGAGQPHLQGRLLRLIGCVGKADPSSTAKSDPVRSGTKSTDPRRGRMNTLRRCPLEEGPPAPRPIQARSEPAGSRPLRGKWTSATDLVFDPTLACCSAGRPAVAARRLSAPRPSTSVRARFAPSPLRTEGRSVTGQDLLLSRTMLSNHGLPYVGRFACDWHRLATTDPYAARSECTRALAA